MKLRFAGAPDFRSAKKFFFFTGPGAVAS